MRDGHKAIDLSHLEYAFDKITMGPELKSMKQNDEAERKTAIHEGGHCLTAYLLHKKGVYGSKPRKARDINFFLRYNIAIYSQQILIIFTVHSSR